MGTRNRQLKGKAKQAEARHTIKMRALLRMLPIGKKARLNPEKISRELEIIHRIMERV